MPKIEAKRDPDAPEVHEVVKKAAERNPQKLRQIGLNYDIANAKGLIEPTEDEQKRKDQKKKEAAEKKKKEKEAADKEKADFEAWKKEEKEEYEAWKKEKKGLEDKAKAEKGEGKADDATSATLEEKDAATSVADDKKIKPSIVVTDNKDPSAEEATPGAQETTSKNATTDADLVTKTAGLKVDDASNDEDKQHTFDEAPEIHSRASSRPASRGRYRPPHMYRGGSRSYYGDEPPREADPRARSPEDNKPKPWNAVCVLGLRVYSQDPDVSIKLLKPKNAEEGAILDVDGDTAAGATM